MQANVNDGTAAIKAKKVAIATLFTIYDRSPTLPSAFDLVTTVTAAMNLYAPEPSLDATLLKSDVEALIRINKALSWMMAHVERNYIIPETVKTTYFRTVRIIASIQGELLTLLDVAIQLQNAQRQKGGPHHD